VIGLLDKLLGEVKISPYSLIELNPLLKSGEIIVKDIIAFYDILSELLKFILIGTFPTKLEDHREAFKLREKYRFLTYFDSLHAAVGIIENLEMASYDGRYAEIIELKYSNPDNLYTSR